MVLNILPCWCHSEAERWLLDIKCNQVVHIRIHSWVTFTNMFTVVSDVGLWLVRLWFHVGVCTKCAASRCWCCTAWMNRSIRTFALFKQMVKTRSGFWWEWKIRFLVLYVQHRLALTHTHFTLSESILRWQISFFLIRNQNIDKKYSLYIITLIFSLYMSVCPALALLQSLLRRLLFPALVAPAITTWTPPRSRSPRLSSFRCRSISACRSHTDTSTMKGSQTRWHYKIHFCPLFP